jgi:hypothetical protein
MNEDACCEFRSGWFGLTVDVPKLEKQRALLKR